MFVRLWFVVVSCCCGLAFVHYSLLVVRCVLCVVWFMFSIRCCSLCGLCCPLFVVCCSALFVVCCLLFAVCWFLVCCSLFVVLCLVFGVFGVWSLSFVVWCSLCGVRCSLFVVCCLLCVVHCSLFVVLCVLHVCWCVGVVRVVWSLVSSLRLLLCVVCRVLVAFFVYVVRGLVVACLFVRFVCYVVSCLFFVVRYFSFVVC